MIEIAPIPMVWRPAVVATVGVSFLPGFRDEEGE